MIDRKPKYRVTVEFVINKRKWLFFTEAVLVKLVAYVYEFKDIALAKVDSIEGIDTAIVHVERVEE